MGQWGKGAMGQWNGAMREWGNAGLDANSKLVLSDFVGKRDARAVTLPRCPLSSLSSHRPRCSA
jgi:hypothetical protein